MVGAIISCGNVFGEVQKGMTGVSLEDKFYISAAISDDPEIPYRIVNRLEVFKVLIAPCGLVGGSKNCNETATFLWAAPTY